MSHVALGRGAGTPHVIIYRASGAHAQGGGAAGSRQPTLSLVYPTPTPWHIKVKGRTPVKGETEFSDTRTLMRHFATRLGSPLPLSLVCNPYCKLVQEHE
jgi:hypothetical protein